MAAIRAARDRHSVRDAVTAELLVARIAMVIALACETSESAPNAIMYAHRSVSVHKSPASAIRSHSDPEKNRRRLSSSML